MLFRGPVSYFTVIYTVYEFSDAQDVLRLRTEPFWKMIDAVHLVTASHG